MTKRARPFDCHVHRQMKVHLSDYENDETALRELKEKTLTRLMEGSRKLYGLTGSSTCNNNNNNTSSSSESDDQETPCHDSRKLMQKFVTNYFSFNGKTSNSNRYEQSTGSSSADCARCSFCDSGQNLHKCINCMEYYCASCSFINYGSFEDTRICMSCS